MHATATKHQPQTRTIQPAAGRSRRPHISFMSVVGVVALSQLVHPRVGGDTAALLFEEARLNRFPITPYGASDPDYASYGEEQVGFEAPLTAHFTAPHL